MRLQFISVSSLVDAISVVGYTIDAPIVSAQAISAHRGTHHIVCTRMGGRSVSVSDGQTEVIVPSVPSIPVAVETLVALRRPVSRVPVSSVPCHV